jgi:hypothetical protein
MISSFRFLRRAVTRFELAELISCRGLASCPQEAVVEATKNSKGVIVQTARQNAAFERFYRAQQICETEEEFAAFLRAARRGLPSVFRVLAHRPESKGCQSGSYDFTLID